MRRIETTGYSRKIRKMCFPRETFKPYIDRAFPVRYLSDSRTTHIRVHIPIYRQLNIGPLSPSTSLTAVSIQASSSYIAVATTRLRRTSGSTWLAGYAYRAQPVPAQVPLRIRISLRTVSIPGLLYSVLIWAETKSGNSRTKTCPAWTHTTMRPIQPLF